MSAAKHTPGPWFVYPHHLDRFTIGDYNGGSGPCRVVADCAPRACITGAGDHSKGEAESEANARLIAAAPELLAALTHYLHVMATAGGGDKQLFMAAIREADDKARAAIVKATGSAS